MKKISKYILGKWLLDFSSVSCPEIKLRASHFCQSQPFLFSVNKLENPRKYIRIFFLNDFDIGPGLGTGDVGMDTTLHRVVACYFLLHY